MFSAYLVNCIGHILINRKNVDRKQNKGFEGANGAK